MAQQYTWAVQYLWLHTKADCISPELVSFIFLTEDSSDVSWAHVIHQRFWYNVKLLQKSANKTRSSRMGEVLTILLLEDYQPDAPSKEP